MFWKQRLYFLMQNFAFAIAREVFQCCNLAGNIVDKFTKLINIKFFHEILYSWFLTILSRLFENLAFSFNFFENVQKLKRHSVLIRKKLKTLLYTNPRNYIGFSIKCFTVDFRQFCCTTVKICFLGGRMSAFPLVPSIVGFPSNFVIS